MARIGGEGGFECVVKKDQFKTGDLGIYFQPDSVLPQNIIDYVEANNKVTIKGGRIRAVSVRGYFSEGLCLPPGDWLEEKDVTEDNDVTDLLGVTKYEPPPPPSRSALRSGKGINFNYKNENFKKYYCVEKFKKCPTVLKDLGQDVVATVKYHGTNFRCGLVAKPLYKKTWWQKLRDFIMREGTQEFLVGSHDKIKKPTPNALKHGDYYNQDTWWRVAKQYNLEKICEDLSLIAHNRLGHKADVAIYGEVIGAGIQKGYDYGIKQGELELRVFDIMIDNKFLSWDDVKDWCLFYCLPCVDEVYRGPWDLSVTKLAEAVDEYNGKKYVREGVVIRPLVESWHPKCGRVIFKYLNPAYLLDKKNTEYH